MARQNEEEDQLKIEVEIFWPFFLARFPGQIQKKSLQPKFEVEIYLALFCGWFPDKTLGCFQDNYPCLVDLLQTFSLLTQMQIQNHNIRFVQLKFTCQVLARGSKETVVVGMGQLQLSTIQKVSQTSAKLN